MASPRPLTLFGSLHPPTLRGVRRWPHWVIAASCVLWSMSCNDRVTDSSAATQLVLEVLQGSPGGGSGTFTGTLQSDVFTAGTVFEDGGRVGMRLAFKDPGTSANPSSPTSANWITVTRYRVDFRRGDGRNVPGVDVPYGFDGGTTFTVIDTISQEFTLVRAQSKLEPPLFALRGLGGDAVISTVAEVTFYGTDQTGAATSATGLIGVTFADFGDTTEVP